MSIRQRTDAFVMRAAATVARGVNDEDFDATALKMPCRMNITVRYDDFRTIYHEREDGGFWSHAAGVSCPECEEQENLDASAQEDFDCVLAIHSDCEERGYCDGGKQRNMLLAFWLPALGVIGLLIAFVVVALRWAS